MQRLHGEYALLFNRRHRKVGHVFQGRFGSKVMRDDDHLWTTARYILRNPVDAGLCKAAEEWRWSSHQGVLEESDARLAGPAAVPGAVRDDGGRPAFRLSDLDRRMIDRFVRKARARAVDYPERGGALRHLRSRRHARALGCGAEGVRDRRRTRTGSTATHADAHAGRPARPPRAGDLRRARPRRARRDRRHRPLPRASSTSSTMQAPPVAYPDADTTLRELAAQGAQLMLSTGSSPERAKRVLDREGWDGFTRRARLRRHLQQGQRALRPLRAGDARAASGPTARSPSATARRTCASARSTACRSGSASIATATRVRCTPPAQRTLSARWQRSSRSWRQSGLRPNVVYACGPSGKPSNECPDARRAHCLLTLLVLRTS